jgi:hypothetical protein
MRIVEEKPDKERIKDLEDKQLSSETEIKKLHNKINTEGTKAIPGIQVPRGKKVINRSSSQQRALRRVYYGK